MIASIDSLLDCIENGLLKEHTYPNVELKKDWAQKYGHKISALANKTEYERTWLVIGVNDDGTLANKDEKWAAETERIVSQQINSYLDPFQASLGINCYEIKHNWIIVIKIGNPGTVTRWDRIAYKASGTTTADMSPSEVMELTIKLPGLTDFSKQKWQGQVDIEPAKSFSRRLCQKRQDLPFPSGEEDYSNVFSYIRIIDTNVMRILFGDFQFRVIFYDTQENPVKNETRTGLYNLLETAFIDEVQTWVRSVRSIGGTPFADKALKEGLANCVAHAYYFEKSGDVIIEVFPDRVSISNICTPDCTYFANKWFSRSHKTVNELLMETLRMAGFVDELGRGKYLIFSESLKEGKKPPYVNIEKAGRFSRWRLNIYGGTKNLLYLKALSRIQKDIYHEPQKALIAYALILWKDKPVKEIRRYIDDDIAPVFAEVLGDVFGPIFYYQREDRVILQRWVRILLEEGKDSKSFTPAEEESLFELCYKCRVTEYAKGVITPKELRKFANMGDTKSEIVLTSSMLKKWTQEGKVEKMKRGMYRIIPRTEQKISYSKLIDLLKARNM
jgi:hypothetical protein